MREGNVVVQEHWWGHDGSVGTAGGGAAAVSGPKARPQGSLARSLLQAAMNAAAAAAATAGQYPMRVHSESGCSSNSRRGGMSVKVKHQPHHECLSLRPPPLTLSHVPFTSPPSTPSRSATEQPAAATGTSSSTTAHTHTTTTTDTRSRRHTHTHTHARAPPGRSAPC